MNAIWKWAALLTLVILTATPEVRGETTNAQPDKKHQYVLVLRPKAQAAKKEPDLEKAGAKELKRWRKGRLIEIPLSAIEHLRKDPTVAYLALVNDGSESDAPTYVIGDAEEESDLKVETTGDDTPPNWDSGLYAYDGAGNIASIGTDTYKYDHAQRLSAAVVSGESLTYTYDSFGNQLQRVVGTAVVATPTAALTNQLDYAAYDQAGNQLSKSGYAQEYHYDALNMMVEKAAALPSRYIYTADDERIGVGHDDEWTWTIRDFSGKVLSTFESTALGELWTWVWVESHHYRDGRLSSAIKVEERTANSPGRYFHLDHLGSPRLITDGSGFKISRHDFHPFGKEQTNYTQEVVDWSYAEIEPMKFTGHERDFVTSVDSNRHDYLDYMHARYYSSPVGRFLSVDPVLDMKVAMPNPQAWNRYSYVRNNPMRWTDPTGKVIDYDESFRKRVRDDATFRAAFEAWKKTKTGAAQWRAMARDTDTKYTLRVGSAAYQPSLLSHKVQNNGLTVPPPSWARENKWGQLNNPWTKSTIDADRMEEGPSARGQARTIAGALLEEVAHALDLGSSSRTEWGTNKAEEQFHADPAPTEPRWIKFMKELDEVLPPEQ